MKRNPSATLSLLDISSVNTISKIVEGGSSLDQLKKVKSKSSISSPSDNRENIKVAIRVRPQLDYEQDHEESISVVDESTVVIKKGKSRSEMFFDHVFPKETTQGELYESVRDTIAAVTEGYNGTIFAYGQTGTGKTFTMMGIDFSSENFNGENSMSTILHDERRGIIPRSVEQIIQHIKKTKKSIKYRVYCSYLEIYNEKIFDLLNYNDKVSHLDVREDRKRGVYVQDLTTVCVSKEEEIFALMEKGAKNRSISSTDMNERSSRSHTIFQMFIEQEPVNPSNQEEAFVKVSKLNLVDLAGSEKWNTIYSNKMGDRRIQEMNSINLSLSALGNCISALMQSNRSHIPFRDSKLTRLLQDSLGGNTKTVFVATVSSSVLAYDESLSTLKFADRAKRVVLNAKVNEMIDDSILIKRYEKEIDRLRKTVEQNSKASSRIANLTEENSKLREENKQLRDFINNKGMGPVSILNSDEVNVHTRFYKKLETLEEIEKDQRGRQKELEDYHDWLHSIPVKYEGEDYSLDIKERLKLMETSIKMQAKELERTKTLFLRDVKIIKEDLDEKTAEIQNHVKLIKEKDEYIKKLKEEKANEDMIRQIQERKPETDRQAAAKFESITEEMKNNLSLGVTAFRENLIEMLNEYLEDTLKEHDDLFVVLAEESKGLIEGCSEALEETIIEAQRDFCEQTRDVIKSVPSVQIVQKEVSTPVATEDQDKSLSNLGIQTNATKNLNQPDVVEFFKNSLQEATRSENDNYWESVCSRVDDLRNVESKLFITLNQSKKHFEKLLSLMDQLKEAKPEVFDFYKKYFTDVLTTISKSNDELLKNSFLQNVQ